MTPSLLYGKASEVPADFVKEAKVLRKTQIADGEVKKLEEVMHRIELEMDGHRFFLIQGYSINDFSKDIQIPVYQISKGINHFRGMSFVDFINQKRIQYCVKKIDSGEWLSYKVEVIGRWTDLIQHPVLSFVTFQLKFTSSNLSL